MRGGVTDAGRTNKRTLKIELLSQWKLEAEFRNKECWQIELPIYGDGVFDTDLQTLVGKPNYQLITL